MQTPRIELARVLDIHLSARLSTFNIFDGNFFRTPYYPYARDFCFLSSEINFVLRNRLSLTGRRSVSKDCGLTSQGAETLQSSRWMLPSVVSSLPTAKNQAEIIAWSTNRMNGFLADKNVYHRVTLVLILFAPSIPFQVRLVTNEISDYYYYYYCYHWLADPTLIFLHFLIVWHFYYFCSFIDKI